MADESSLRWIGISFGALTAMVALIAILVVANVDRSGFERPPVQTAASTSNAG